MKPSVIICGPQGSGKTVNKEALARSCGMEFIRDDWFAGQPFHLNNYLHLTNDSKATVKAYLCKHNGGDSIRVVEIADALRAAGLAPDGVFKSPGAPTDVGYEKLRDVLDRAFHQASAGKGKERHATEEPFEEQTMQRISRTIGSIDGLIYQAHKKSAEALRLPPGADVKELLGAIVYLAGAVIARESWNKR